MGENGEPKTPVSVLSGLKIKITNKLFQPNKLSGEMSGSREGKFGAENKKIKICVLPLFKFVNPCTQFNLCDGKSQFSNL